MQSARSNSTVAVQPANATSSVLLSVARMEATVSQVEDRIFRLERNHSALRRKVVKQREERP